MFISSKKDKGQIERRGEGAAGMESFCPVGEGLIGEHGYLIIRGSSGSITISIPVVS